MPIVQNCFLRMHRKLSAKDMTAKFGATFVEQVSGRIQKKLFTMKITLYTMYSQLIIVL